MQALGEAQTQFIAGITQKLEQEMAVAIDTGLEIHEAAIVPRDVQQTVPVDPFRTPERRRPHVSVPTRQPVPTFEQQQDGQSGGNPLQQRGRQIEEDILPGAEEYAAAQRLMASRVPGGCRVPSPVVEGSWKSADTWAARAAVVRTQGGKGGKGRQDFR